MTANAMSGRVANGTYINELMTSRYGTFRITAKSAVEAGAWAVKRWTRVSIGVEIGFTSSELN